MRAFVVVPLLLIAACSQPAPVANTAADIGAAANRAQGDIDRYAANLAVPVERREPAHQSMPATEVPVAEATLDAGSAEGAAEVVRRYYALAGDGKYHQAWALWSGKGEASGQSADAFAASFADYRGYRATVGAPGRIDAGAGQRYVTVPVQVDARLKSGAPTHLVGSVVLHRTGDIDAATAQDRAWRINSIDLKPAPPAQPR